MATKKKIAPAPKMVPTKVQWLDRILGGGITPGGTYMVVGGPGVGKSTMLMQAIDGFVSAKRKALYITGDERMETLVLRFARVNPKEAAAPKPLHRKSKSIDLLATRHPGKAAGGIRTSKPALVVVDGLDCFRDALISTSQAGSRFQIENLMDCCMAEADAVGAAIVFVFPTTKAGEPIGPKNATSFVDCRLELRNVHHDDIDFGDGPDPGPRRPYRRLTASKNRFNHGARIDQESILQITPAGLLAEV